jgi:hypothetical protein
VGRWLIYQPLAGFLLILITPEKQSNPLVRADVLGRSQVKQMQPERELNIIYTLFSSDEYDI